MILQKSSSDRRYQFDLRGAAAVPGCGAEAVPAVRTTTCIDNLPALSLQDDSSPPTWRIAVTAFLIQPWLFCRAAVPLIRSRERLITISASVCVDSWMTTGWNIRIYFPLKDKFNTNATGLNPPLFSSPPPQFYAAAELSFQFGVILINLLAWPGICVCRFSWRSTVKAALEVPLVSVPVGTADEVARKRVCSRQ